MPRNRENTNSPSRCKTGSHKEPLSMYKSLLESSRPETKMHVTEPPNGGSTWHELSRSLGASQFLPSQREQVSVPSGLPILSFVVRIRQVRTLPSDPVVAN